MQRSQAVRLGSISILAPLLVGGGFALGRASGDGADPVTTTVTTAGKSGYDPAESINDYDAADVVKVFPPTIVRDGEILEQKKGSPERALLEWWQAYQFSDLRAVVDLTSKSTIETIGEDELKALVNLPGPGLGGVEVLGASTSGNGASVEAGLLNFAPKKPGGPPSRKPTSSQPVTFAMEREGGEWRFAATEYLSLKLNSLPD